MPEADDGLSALLEWLKARFSKAPYAVWSVASVASTLLTFVPLVPFKFSGLIRPALILVAIASFARANFKLFQSKQTQIADLEGDLRLQEGRIRALEEDLGKRNERVSQLTIHPGKGSRYILRPINTMPGGEFNGGYFEFRLRVENVGKRNSVVNEFRVEIRELGLDRPNLFPEEGQRRMQGRHCLHGLDAQSGLSTTRILQIAPESSTREGTLAFIVEGLNLDTFVSASTRMHGDQRMFGTLHCRLTLTDSSGTTASADFELPEN
jgi:hypothetical protein